MRKICRRIIAYSSCSVAGIIILLLFLSVAANAQQYLFDHFTTAGGLPSNMAYRCARDAEGFIWVATSGGVARYDGQSFETFSEADGLPDNDIVYLFIDHRNKVWFFGFNGHTSFYANGTMHTAVTDKWLRSLQSEDEFVLYHAEDRQHNIFLVYNNSSVKCITAADSAIAFSERGNIFFAYDKLWRLSGKFEYTPNKVLHSVYGTDSLPVPPLFAGSIMQRTAFEPSIKGNLIYFKSKEIYTLSNKDFSFRFLFRSPVPITRLRYLGDTSIALLTPGAGVYFYSLRQNRITQHLLDGETITDALLDANGDIWCTSLNNGLFYLPDSRARARYVTAAEHLGNEKCTAVFTNSSVGMWVGMDDARVQVFAHEKLQHTISCVAGRNNFGRINNIIPLPEGGMCIATDVGMFLADNCGGSLRKVYFFEPQKQKILPLNGIKSCCITTGGDVLVAVSGCVERLSVAARRTRMPVAVPVISLPDRVLCVFEDSEKGLWIGTARGLIRIRETDTTLLYKQNSLLTKRVLQIGETGSGYMVLATDGAGIIVLKNKQVCAHLTARNGLPGNICRRMFISGDTLYAATTAGIAIVCNSRSKGISTLAVTEKDGLLSADCRDVSVIKGHLYAATDKGISILSLTDIFSPRPQPVTYLKKILADGKPVSTVVGPVSLQYGVRSVTVNYGAVSQHATGGIEYRYRTMPGADWIITDAPSFVYNDPQPQDMEVTVQSRYKGGAWDSGKTILITIAPLFYQRAWFICMVILALLAAAGAGFIFYYRKQRQKLFNQNRLVKLESQANQAMMNPHFVFNSLNSVQHFLNENDNYAANQYLTRFSRLIRRHLELNRRQYISLDEEFDFLRLYLEVEKSRCDGRLVFSMQVEPGIEPEEVFVPVLIIQPLVENAIWHGINPRAEGGNIVITAGINEQKYLEIKISDDGVGFQNKETTGHESMGLDIINDRLQLLAKLYRQEFSVHYATVTAGTTVIVRFPLLKETDLLPLF